MSISRWGVFCAALIVFALTTIVSAGVSKVDTALLDAAQKAFSKGISTNQLVRALGSGLWNSNRTAMAASITRPKGSVVFVFLLQSNGTYLATDASGVEDGNFGVLGRPRTDYERFETTPIQWLHRDDGKFQVVMRTRAWRGGQRYTVSEPLLIRPDGLVMRR